MRFNYNYLEEILNLTIDCNIYTSFLAEEIVKNCVVVMISMPRKLVQNKSGKISDIKTYSYWRFQYKKKVNNSVYISKIY